MDDDNDVPKKRRTLYYTGLIMAGSGFLIFASRAIFPDLGFLTGDDPFASMQISSITTAVGFGLFAVGGILAAIGARGLYGSGFLLNPRKARDDLKPYSKMFGGMVDDALGEVHGHEKPATEVKVRCQACKTLNDEGAKYCIECGSAM